MKKQKGNRNLVKDALWERGELSFLLYKHQLVVYEDIQKAILNDDLKYVLNIARRFGKSTILSLIAIEQALRVPKSQIRYAAPLAKEIKKALRPIFDCLFETAPKRLVPTFNSTDNVFKFKNGSEIHVSGVNNGNADSLRGSRADLVIVDEAAQIDDLKYLINSILMPQTLTTNAITIIASTPGVSRDNDFFEYYLEAEEGGYLSTYTIFDNTALSDKRVINIMNDCGGENSTTWRREYLVEFCQDEKLDIIPEWDKCYITEYLTDELFDYYHKYVAMDIGTVDKTAILYGVYDFQHATLNILSESVMNGNELTTKLIAANVRDSEYENWGEGITPHKRISDNNNLILLADLNKLHGLHFLPTLKDNLDAMISEVRLFINQGRLKVHPDCVQLIGCLTHGVWANNKVNREFARSKIYGHYDALAALVYLIRNLDTRTNPIPPWLGIIPENYFVSAKAINQGSNEEQVKVLKKILLRRKR